MNVIRGNLSDFGWAIFRDMFDCRTSEQKWIMSKRVFLSDVGRMSQREIEI